jgi:ABC-type transport system substrate-binding protein
MRSIRRISVAVLGLLAALLGGCPEPPDGPRYEGAGRQEPHHGGTFVFHHESNVRGLDPHISFDELSTMSIRLVFDGLLDYDPEANLVPSLAKSMPEVKNDGRTYRFELHEGVQFHNGRELTARDVKWSMEHMLSPEVGSPGYSFYTNIEGAEAYHEGEVDHVSGIEVTGRYGIEFTLAEPDQTFLNAMAMTFAYPVPKENYEAHPRDVAFHPVGTGPYELEKWERGVRLIFEKNEDYWREGKPYVDRMIFLENIKRDVAIMRFRNGDIDHAHRFSPADYVFFRQSSKWDPYTYQMPEATVWGLIMNCQLHPFDNVHVRRAVAHAIDRERWARARNQRIRPTGQPIPPGITGYTKDLKHRQDFDLQEAKKEMRLAGYPDGLDEPVTLWTGDGRTSRFYGELAQADLEKIGIDIELKQVAFPVFLQETGKPKTAQMVFSGWVQDFPDPADFLDILFHTRAIHKHDSENKAFYRNPKLDALLNRARVETDPDKREQMYVEASNIVAKDAPWAFTFNEIKFEARQPYVKNYRPHPVWRQNYRFVWLDLPRKRIAREYRGHPFTFARLASWFPLGGL